ncbi:MAG: hypothetical protein AB9895_00120 [Negativicutes bacterium]
MNVTLILKFTDAIQKRKLVRLKFFTGEYQPAVRKCVPLDIAPSRRSKNKIYKFHIWDLDSDPKPHILSLDPNQILQMEVLEEYFDPEDIVTWDTKASPWTIKRDWDNRS